MRYYWWKAASGGTPQRSHCLRGLHYRRRGWGMSSRLGAVIFSFFFLFRVTKKIIYIYYACMYSFFFSSGVGQSDYFFLSLFFSLFTTQALFCCSLLTYLTLPTYPTHFLFLFLFLHASRHLFSSSSSFLSPHTPSLALPRDETRTSKIELHVFISSATLAVGTSPSIFPGGVSRLSAPANQTSRSNRVIHHELVTWHVILRLSTCREFFL